MMVWASFARSMEEVQKCRAGMSSRYCRPAGGVDDGNGLGADLATTLAAISPRPPGFERRLQEEAAPPRSPPRVGRTFISLPARLPQPSAMKNHTRLPANSPSSVVSTDHSKKHCCDGGCQATAFLRTSASLRAELERVVASRRREACASQAHQALSMSALCRCRFRPDP